MATISPELLPSDMPCDKDAALYNQDQLIALGCSLFIIVMLTFLEKRTDQTKCPQRPGLIYPVNLLDHCSDAYGYAAAFGSMASHCWNLFWNSESTYSQAPDWSKSLVIMWTVIYIGLLYYPLFACLSTKWIFVGSFFGLGYSSFWFWIYLRTVITCPDGAYGNLKGENIAVLIPDIACLLFLMLKYAVTFVKHTIQVVRNRSASPLIHRIGRVRLASPYNMCYVKNLLIPSCQAPVLEYIEVPAAKVRHRLRFLFSRWLYMNDPTFKYSPRVLCTFTVALICAYQFGIILLLLVYEMEKLVPYFYPDATNSSVNATGGDNAELLFQIRLGLKVFNNSVIVSFTISSLLTIFAIFQILTNYRRNIKRMYKGDFKHLPFGRNNRHPMFIMSDSFSYAGSQIAYILWGYVVVFAVLVLACFIVAYTIVLPVFNIIPRDVLKVIGNLLPGVVILQGFLIFQKVFARFFLQRRTSFDSKGNETTVPVLALDNRKLYHNVSYFLFFFYIVLGVFGCLLTIVKGVVLGVFYLARLDKCGLMEGYERWDTGYMYYISFLHLEECHRHPVLLVFCDILIENYDKSDVHLTSYGSNHSFNQSETATYQRSISRCTRPQRLARNRWLKAYTLIRNPRLIEKNIEDDYDQLVELDRYLV